MSVGTEYSNVLDVEGSNRLISALRLLVKQRWVPLRRLSYILGYTHGTGIYGRQRSKNPDHHIPTVKVGGTLRVHYDDVILALENPLKPDLEEPYNIILGYIRSLEKEKEKEET